jgi:hypothetical protein
MYSALGLTSCDLHVTRTVDSRPKQVANKRKERHGGHHGHGAHHGYRHGEYDCYSKPHHRDHSSKDDCCSSECDEEEARDSHAGGCCGGLTAVRRYCSPEERKEAVSKYKETILKYIDELKKEIAGAEAELEKL